MTQEDKHLLLEDLCARLPYGVKVQIDLQSDIYPARACRVCSIEYAESGSAFIGVETWPYTYNEFREFLCKPYLFPLSSMTEEQKREYHELIGGFFGTSALISFESLTDFFNKNHIDYRGLIPIGLANDATGLNIY